MKIPAILTCFLILSFFPGICSGNILIGIKGGMTRSNIRLTDMPAQHINLDKPDIWRHAFSPKSGVSLSLIASYSISYSFQIIAEPGFITKGANFTSSESKLTLYYWNLPLKIGYSLTKSINIEGGLEFSYLSKARLDENGTITRLDEFYDNNPEMSLILGIEKHLNRRIGFGVNYCFGLTHVSRTEWKDDLGNIDSRCKEYNHYLSLNLVLLLT